MPILRSLWDFFKNPKIQKSYNIHPIFLRVVWWSKRWKWSLKSQKTRFLSLFQHRKKAWKKRVFYDFQDHLHLFDHQTTLKNITWILYDFCIFGILTKTLINSSKRENRWEYFRGYFLIRWDNATKVQNEKIFFGVMRILLFSKRVDCNFQ